MSEVHAGDPTSTPTTEVVVYRDGVEIHRQLCESEADAVAIVAYWEEYQGVECEVSDLSTPQDDATEVNWVDEAADYPAASPDQDR